jgi:hypothetical protein
MTNDKKLFEISCRETLLEIVKDSEVINKNLTFYQKVLLFDKIKVMPLKEIVELFFQEAREIETKDERDTKYGAAMVAGGVAAKMAGKYLNKKPSIAVGAAIGVGLMFIYRRLTDPCFRETIKILDPSKRKIARLHCENRGIEAVISKIQNDLKRCDQANNPEKCRDKLAYELSKWREKYQENLVEITKARKPPKKEE